MSHKFNLKLSGSDTTNNSPGGVTQWYLVRPWIQSPAPEGEEREKENRKWQN
jgi:hypothetical protein